DDACEAGDAAIVIARGRATLMHHDDRAGRNGFRDARHDLRGLRAHAVERTTRPADEPEPVACEAWMDEGILHPDRRPKPARMYAGGGENRRAAALDLARDRRRRETPERAARMRVGV